tara:strand:+ start:470 stop:685 length:216 start_codon:yes stop_codon:yes gene_type:complete
MAYVAKSFIGDATALADGTADARGVDSLAEQVQNYLSSTITPAGSAGAREIKVTCTALRGDRVFVLVTAET